MENTEKKSSSGVDELTEIIETAKEEIKKALQNITEDEKKNLGKKLRDELERKKTSVEEVVEEEKEAKRLPLREVRKRSEGRQVLTTFTKVIEAIRLGLEPELISSTIEGAIFLKKIAEQRIDFTPSTASSILFYFGDFLLGEKEIIEPTTGRINPQLINNFQELKKINPAAAKILKETFRKIIKEEKILPLSDEEFERYFSLEDYKLEESLVEIPPELKANLPIDREEIKETIEAILSPENFLVYIKKHRERIIEEKRNRLGRDLTPAEMEEVNIILSEYIEHSISDLVAELYNKADADPSYRRMPFHEVESIGFFQSLQNAYNIISTKIQLLGRVLSEKDLNGISFFARFSEKKEIQKEVVGKEIVTTFISPLRKPKKISTADFFRILNLEISHIRELREFTHNARIVFRFPSGGDQSPWAQLAEYANRIMMTSDFDAIPYLPHSEVYQDALNIYTGLLQAELAKHDWILDPKLFVGGGDGLNDLERQTLDILKEKYKGKKNEYQIHAAFSMAQGVAMAVLLTEPETIANADPNFKHKSTPGGGRIDPTYLGEWLSDTVVTGVLNPFLRGHLRWLSEGTVGGPIGFLPIPDPKLVKGWRIGIWDHELAIKDIENFHRRFFEGRTDLLKEGHLTLFDIRNPGRIGSFATRGGWRWAEAYQGLFYDYRQGKLVELSFSEKWRRLENVGFEPLLHFHFDNKNAFLESLKSDEDFKKYIFTKYFQRIYKTEEDFNNALKKNSDMIFYGVVIEFLINRLPAKIITEERTRFSDGQRIWEILRTRLDFDFETMDQAVKDLVIAQTALRQALSQEMRRNELDGKDIGQVSGVYELNEETVEGYLKASGITDEQRIKNVQKLIKEFRTYFTPSLDEKGVEEKKYDQWLTKIKGGRSTIPFALAPEETDYRYLTLRSTGTTTIKRTLGDTASADKVLTPAYGKFLSILRKMAISGKKDMSELVQFLSEIKQTLVGLHGKGYANEIVCYFAYLAISYFKKDTFAKPLGGLVGLGQKTSIAAEFAGASGRVWEWDSRDIGRFVFALEQAGVLEKEPYELQKEPSYEPIRVFGYKLPEEINLSKWFGAVLGRKGKDGEIIPIKFLGREIKLKVPKVRKKDFEIYSNTLKKMAGGEFIHKVWDAINTVIPIALAVILIMLIQKAFKEAFEQKK